VSRRIARGDGTLPNHGRRRDPAASTIGIGATSAADAVAAEWRIAAAHRLEHALVRAHVATVAGAGAAVVTVLVALALNAAAARRIAGESGATRRIVRGVAAAAVHAAVRGAGDQIVAIRVRATCAAAGAGAALAAIGARAERAVAVHALPRARLARVVARAL